MYLCTSILSEEELLQHVLWIILRRLDAMKVVSEAIKEHFRNYSF